MIDIRDSHFVKATCIPASNADDRVNGLIGYMSIKTSEMLLSATELHFRWVETYDEDWTTKRLDRYCLLKRPSPVQDYTNICLIQQDYRCYLIDATNDQVFDKLSRVINLQAFL